MQAGLRVGRVGSLTLYLNYTWILAAVLISWWVALLWLPEHFPAWSTGLNWLAAIAVVLLFLLSVVAHEMVHTVVAGTGPRTVNLFPFGAAVPFRLQDTGAARAIASALAAPLFNTALGIGLLVFGSAVSGPGSPIAGLAAVATPLGLLNLWLGLFNLIPGIPFDGGWALAAGAFFFSNDREGGLDAALAVGRWAALLLVLLGAWRGLTSDMWLQALGLVTLGWIAREAIAARQGRSTVRNLLAQLTASDFMQPSPQEEATPESATVADLVRAHPHFPPAMPLPVVDASGSLVGLTTIGAADALLQGTWPVTPVRAISKTPSQLGAVRPDTPLVEVLMAAQANEASDISADPDVIPYIPVIAGGKLVGSIDPAKLYDFEQAGQQFGVQELVTPATGAATRQRGLMRRIWSFVPVVMLIAAMAILGNIALHTNPAKLGEAVEDPTSTLTFSRLFPAEGDIVGTNGQTISVQVEAASPVTTGTLFIDGEPLETTLTGSSPMTQTASAKAPSLTSGPHRALISATTESGEHKNHEWQFRVVYGAPNPESPPGGQAAGPTPTSQPTQSAAAVQLSGYAPSLGSRVPAGGAGMVGVDLKLDGASGASGGAGATGISLDVHVTLDGRELESKVAPVAGSDGQYRVVATAPSLQAGGHRVRVDVAGDGVSPVTSEWTFNALLPDENNAYFKETGYFVSQPFLKYWQENGGLGLFGYPISDLVYETDKQTGETYTAQYFERARFEQHPSLGGNVLLGRLGAILHAPEPSAQPIDGAQFFAETGHNLSGAFLTYWNEHGGLAVFGYPISEERTETNPADGKDYTVQYFERARFELHPEKAGTPFEVQLGLLGAELYSKLYGR